MGHKEGHIGSGLLADAAETREEITRKQAEDLLRRNPVTNRHIWRMIGRSLLGAEYDGQVTSRDISRPALSAIASRLKQVPPNMAVPVSKLIEDANIKIFQTLPDAGYLDKVAFNYYIPAKDLAEGKDGAEVEFNKIIGFDMGEAGFMRGDNNAYGAPTYRLGNDLSRELQYGLFQARIVLASLGPCEAIKAGYLGIYENVSDIRAPRDGFSSIVPF